MKKLFWAVMMVLVVAMAAKAEMDLSAEDPREVESLQEIARTGHPRPLLWNGKKLPHGLTPSDTGAIEIVPITDKRFNIGIQFLSFQEVCRETHGTWEDVDDERIRLQVQDGWLKVDARIVEAVNGRQLKANEVLLVPAGHSVVVTLTDWGYYVFESNANLEDDGNCLDWHGLDPDEPESVYQLGFDDPF